MSRPPSRKDKPRPRSRRRPADLVLIDIDPAVAGGFMLGRFDITIHGRAIATAPIAEVRLVNEQGAPSVLRLPPDDPGTAVELPDGTPAWQRWFQLTMPLSAHTEGACDCAVEVELDSGAEYEQPYTLLVDPLATPTIRVQSGPVFPPGDRPWVRPPLVLYVERALLDADGNLQVQGWAVGFTPILLVQAYAGDTLIAAGGVTGEREDVAQVFPHFPTAGHAGFSLSGQVAGDAPELIRVVAMAGGGATHTMLAPVERVTDRRLRPTALPEPTPPAEPDPDPEPPLAASDPRREIVVYCDKASLSPGGRLLVVGWAVCAAGISRIAIFCDDRLLGTADYGMERLDVGARFSGDPTAAQSGFRFEAPIGAAPEGAHVVHLVVSNAQGDDITLAANITAEEIPPAQDTPAPDRPEFRFELDSPPVVEGVVVEPVTGRLTIEGWVLARSGVAAVQVWLDDRHLGEAHYGLARQDVGAAFPDWVNALRSGYAFHCPPRSLRDGEHTVRVVVTARNGQEHTHGFRMTVKRADDSDEPSNIRRRMPRAEVRTLLDTLDRLAHRPLVHLLLRLPAAADPAEVALTLASLHAQAYPHWRLRVLAAGAVAAALVDDPDCEVVTPDAPAWTEPLAVEPDDLVGLLTPGDELGVEALLELVLRAGLHRDADLLYGDEVRISPASGEREPFFKPDFSPDLLLSTNYIGRPWLASGRLLAATGATPAGLADHGEYDLLLRCAERARGVQHVPKLLVQRGPAALDTPALEQAALAAALARRSTPASVLPTPVAGTWRVRRDVVRPGKVSIIIPTCAAHGYIETCITSLRKHTTWPDYEIIVIDNIPARLVAWKLYVETHADKLVDIPEAFNWSRFNNRAVEAAAGEYLLFLNDDIEITQPDWLQALLEHAQRPEVGVVGPQLLYPDGKVQHAGMFLGVYGLGRHAFRFNAADEPGYFGLAITQRNVLAVTGACMLVRRDTFARLGGFDEAHEVVNNDLDFCLRAHQSGFATIFTPYASLIHHELASRARLKDEYDLSRFNAAWKTLYAAGDPYFNPRLSRHADDYRPDDEPVQTIVAGHTLFDRDEIRRILVVKLDHIGDFITALPAIRRLKRLFPAASISVLAGRASQAFVELEPAIDAFIPFDFFHARSQLGQKALTDADYVALRQELAAHRFDLAIDLRKHLSTRDVLRHTGARFLAGYDYQGQFPFLDIALEWEGDKALQHKRAHIVDDMLALVNAVGQACEPDEPLVAAPPAPPAAADLPEAVRALFDRPVVAVHPGAGNTTKQWPVEHFSALIELLMERNGVNVLLVGGPDEVLLADTLLAGVRRQDRIGSLAGQTSLAELGRVLTACALYIGNDSGPKHIAAALGVPTIGIHSGVVDAVEWAPRGRRAVALRRAMSCSPCYLANADDCPRNLACLRFLEPALVHQTAELLLAGLRGVCADDAAGPGGRLPGEAGAAGAPGGLGPTGDIVLPGVPESDPGAEPATGPSAPVRRAERDPVRRRPSVRRAAR
jgi:ADP-heptose:LPS heptosyltransferase/GT2 family glycosyltransferase